MAATDPALIEALRRIDLAIGGVHTIDLGPVDYNVAQTTDDLLAAISLIEEFGRSRLAEANSLATSREARQ